MNRKVLIVDDDINFNTLLAEALEQENFMIDSVLNIKNAKNRLEKNFYDVILLDVMLQDGNGLEILEDAKKKSHGVLVMSAYGNVETAVNAVRKGAFNFLEKPFDLNHLIFEIYRMLELKDIKQEVDFLKDEKRTIDDLLGNHQSIQKIKELIKIIAKRKISVLIQGETGTGKEVIQKIIHNLSNRDKNIAINCGAIPESLFESELFGYVKGAFTGAEKDKKGLIEDANKGTLFLDEVGEMPLKMQPKLLRILETESVQRVGSNMQKKVDIRLICATNKDLEDLVNDGKFREDLFYRLNVVKITVPPLRERRSDIPILFEKFFYDALLNNNIKNNPIISNEFIQTIVEYKWPGNVRELKNLAELTAVLYGKYKKITLEELNKNYFNNKNDENCFSEDMTLSEVEGRYLKNMLKKYKNKTKIAKILNISKSTLYEKIKKHNLL